MPCCALQDVVPLYSDSWFVIQFVAANPGVWMCLGWSAIWDVWRIQADEGLWQMRFEASKEKRWQLLRYSKTFQDIPRHSKTFQDIPRHSKTIGLGDFVFFCRAWVRPFPGYRCTCHRPSPEPPDGWQVPLPCEHSCELRPLGSVLGGLQGAGFLWGIEGPQLTIFWACFYSRWLYIRDPAKGCKRFVLLVALVCSREF